MSYANGRYPLHLFVHRGGNLYFTPSLNARWNEMVRLAVEKYGVRLYVTGDIDGLGGWNVYRPFDPQVAYRRHYGIRAAVPGTSSHGGKFRGQEVFALDIANVNALAPGNQSLANARLTALARAVGLTVNFVTPIEWWHVGDFNPPWTAPSFGAVAINPGTTNRPEEDDMSQQSVRMPNGKIYAVATGSIVHMKTLSSARITTNVNSTKDEIHPISGTAEFADLLDGMLIPRDVLDAAGNVYNPESGRFEEGGAWSWARVNRAANTAIRAEQVEQAKRDAAIRTEHAEQKKRDEALKAQLDRIEKKLDS